MRIPYFAVPIFLAAPMLLGMAAVSGQDFPSKPIRLVTGSPGSNADFASRVLAQGFSAATGQQVIVDNRASGVILGTAVAKAPPDGYTLLVTGSSFWLLPFLQDNSPWDPVKDFMPVTLAVSSPSMLVAHPSLPVKSVKEVIALAKSRPGELNYASGTAGTTNHLAAELFKSMAHVNIVRVPYKGGDRAVNDLIGGQVQLMFPVAAFAMPHVKSGRLRGLAVLSAKPSALVPGLPTAMESGLPGYESVSLQGLFAPAKTPAAIINRLNQEAVRVLNRSDVKETLFKSGIEALSSSPEEFAAMMKSEMARLGKVIKDLGIKVD